MAVHNIEDFQDDPVQILARTLWGEGRGESLLGRAAIACTIINRVEANSWYGRGIYGVCVKGFQYSCWNVSDPNREKCLSVDESDKQFRECLVIAELATGGAINDVTSGSTHYHTNAVKPSWAEGKNPVIILGPHLFYNDID